MEPPYSRDNADKGSFLSSLRRLRVVGVTEAVGDEDVKVSCGDVVAITISDDGEELSVTVRSRLISSLLLRDTDMDFAESMA